MDSNASINGMLVTATQDYLVSDKLKKYIEEAAEKMINETIKDALGWNGKIKKQVEGAIKNELCINQNDLGIAGHNKFLTEMISKRLKKYLREDVQIKMDKMIVEVLGVKEKEMSLDKFRTELREFAEDRDCYCGDPDDLYESDLFTFIVKDSDHSWVTLYIDDRPDIADYKCKFQLTVHENFTSYKIHNEDCKAHDKVLAYQFGMEDYIYSLFLNEVQINHTECKESADD